MFNMSNVKFLVGRGTLYIQKYSPEILTAVGIIGGAGTVVLATKAAVKSQIHVYDLRADVANVKDLHDNYPENQSNSRGKDLTRVHVTHGLRITKVYVPTITLGLFSATAILTAHGIMRRRNFALVAVVKSLETSLTEFQNRVALEIGEDRALELSQGIETETYKDENGKKQTRKVINSAEVGEYQRVFDIDNPNYQVDPNYNKTFLDAQETYANQLLVARGHVFLNDIFDALGFSRTPAGAVTGWLYDPNNSVDGYIDFGMHQVTFGDKILQVNDDSIMHEDAFLLNFNVDGTIWDKIR